MNSATPKVLFLPGISKKMLNASSPQNIPGTSASLDSATTFLADSLDYSTGSMNSHGDRGDYPDNTGLDPLPRVFRSVDTWPTKTGVMCWNCASQFDTRPVFIPEFIDLAAPDQTEHNIRTQGTFCSFYCARNYIHARAGSRSDKMERMYRLKLLYSLLNDGAEMSELTPLVSPHEMVKFGGSMSSKEFARIAKDADEPNYTQISRSF